MHVRYSPLAEQYANPEPILDEIRGLIASGDYTLGRAVSEFEALFAETLSADTGPIGHAIGVGSGTDALKIALRALELPPGGEVITTANTFWATVGAIHEAGLKPVFVDCDESQCTDAALLEAAITSRTVALMPVHLTGDAADMPRVMEIAARHGLPVVEDACQSLMAEIDGRRVGTFGQAAGFSMHPLKIINVWGDAGIVVTNDAALDERCRLLRNHGLRNRDEMVMLGYNSRLDSLQAIVGKWIVRQVEQIVADRAQRAAYYDHGFQQLDGVRIPPRSGRVKHVYLLYVLYVDRRDELVQYCLERGIEVKVHYPVPLYRQPAMEFLGYKSGDFPVADRHATEMLTLPVDQHLTRAQQDYVIETIRSFYGDKA